MGRSDVAVTRRERSAGIPRRYRADRAGHQRSSASPRWRAIGQAPVGPVREHGEGGGGARPVDASGTTRRRRSPRASPRRSSRGARSRGRSGTPARARRCGARPSPPPRSGDTIRPAKKRRPERVDVGRGREDAAVAGAAHGQVEHVGAEPVGGEVAERGVAGQLVERRKAVASMPAGAADQLVDEVVVGRAGRPLGQEGEDARSRRCSTRTRSPGANFVGWPSSTARKSSVVASWCTGTAST